MKANRLAPCSWNKKKGKSPLEKGKPLMGTQPAYNSDKA